MRRAARLFDVTLRDGLQTRNQTYSLDVKKTILDWIIRKHDPKHIEVGSLVSNTIMPQMAGSIDLYKYGEERYPENTFYLLVPNISYLKKGVSTGIKNFSFVTSVSDAFQKKNVKMDLHRTKGELDDSMKYLQKNGPGGTKKLYVSCINECPILGKFDNNRVADELLYYKYYYDFDNICLSDTCGTLKYTDLRTIVELVLNYGMDPNKMSVHLHVDNSDIEKIDKMINFLLCCGITMFDVSSLADSGGCSVTIGEGKTRRNLTYKDLNMKGRN